MGTAAALAAMTVLAGLAALVFAARRGACARPALRPSRLTEAVRLARAGADAGEIARRCRLPRSQAELVLALHRGPPR